MAVTKSVFGKSAEGKEISLYTLSNDQGMKAEITDLGATLVRVLVPDATGKADDLVLGFDNGKRQRGHKGQLPQQQSYHGPRRQRKLPFFFRCCRNICTRPNSPG